MTKLGQHVNEMTAVAVKLQNFSKSCFLIIRQNILGIHGHQCNFVLWSAPTDIPSPTNTHCVCSVTIRMPTQCVCNVTIRIHSSIVLAASSSLNMMDVSFLKPCFGRLSSH